MRETAIIQLSMPTNYVGPEDERPNCESWYINGVEYTVAYDKPVEVPLQLAQRMKDAGRIKAYRPVNKA